ncbi:acetylornithine deacetylase [Amylibacter sp. IMCC11727]|uniref:acetylornithine deacetylase n=1 Tax=Amylibacter sp. IMCC11727 TaxID=3039851 RepID=UPI00244E47AF|nr:acetylornithine deacetylase [Amylibacter sp. IMCC11727]WGI21155.1 acetylornithine deacetylase [Amylibacter sp. IMCC11727]
MNTIEILDRLIAYDTVSANPNLDLIEWCAELIKDAGGDVTLIPDATGKKANLFATIGPRDQSGVMLSGHTDVVPVEGQAWTKPPFELTLDDGKYFGRGTCDMKGFVAAALSAALTAAQSDLKTPLHLALSYDEEIGCIGVRSLVDMLADAPFKPKFCIVGEPTSMQVAVGHKGKMAAKATMIGREGHSALAPMAVNAIHMGVDFVNVLRDLQDRLAQKGAQDDDYSVPYTTIHVGKINAGVALNIVPNTCEVLFEIRSLAQDDPDALMDEIRAQADAIVAQYQPIAPEAAITIERTANTYPGLSTPEEAAVVQFVKSLLGANDTMKVAFGTEGGLFSEQVGIPTVVCGPGSMEQGHKPDEFVSVDQLAKCDDMLANLVARLKDGID